MAMDKKIIFAVLNLLFFLYLVSYTNLDGWESLSCALGLYLILEFLDNLGNKINFLDLAIILAVLTCLVMPIPFYHEYTIDNHLARLWKKYMPIPSETYYSYV